MTFVSMAKVHIGKKIKEVWKASRLKGTEFARLINKDRQVIYDIFQRETIDTGLLDKISKVLNHDFFSYYNSEPSPNLTEKTPNYGYASQTDLENLTEIVKKLTGQVEKLIEVNFKKSKTTKTKAKKKA